jgi:general secretion pathway protein B
MSYILDALRRADAQRERDPARGIHAQPAAGVPAGSAPGSPRWAWPAGAAAVLLLAGGWVLWQQAAQPVTVPVQPAVAVPVATAAEAAVPVPAAALLPPAPPPLPAAEVERVAARSAPAAVLKAPPPASAAAPAKAEAAPVQAPAAPVAPPPRILSVAELPAAVKGELPKLAITGGVWSEDPGQRLLIVGGKVVSEGAELAPGVVLEQIRSRSAVMRFKGLRYSVGF